MAEYEVLQEGGHEELIDRIFARVKEYVDALPSVQHASTEQYGVTKLYGGIDSTSNDLAGTAAAVRTAYSLAEGAFAAGDFYGVCSTAGATGTKVVTVDSRVTELYAGLTVTVKFNYAQLYDGTPTLNVNDLGQRYIMRRYYTSGQQEGAGLYEWQAGEVLQLTYNGTYWVIAGGARRGSKFATLWTNSSPTTAFAAQTITGISPSDYDLIMIEYTQTASSASPRMSEIVAYSSGRKTWLSYMDADGGLFGAFRAATLYASSIEFSSCYDEADATQNGQCIPTAVIGIKF